MGKVEITLQSSKVTKTPRKDREPSVFKRSIAKLSEDKRHPGKILPVYVNIDNDYKVFGVFTLNTGGSVSFFPDFLKIEEQFDHLTLNKDFINKKVHLTKVESNGSHKKAYPIEVAKLPSGSYHLVTFGMKDGDLLMDSLPQVRYPDIEFEDEHKDEFLELLKDAINIEPQMLDFPDEKGSFFIQVQVVPKGADIGEISIETGFANFFKLSKIIPKKINSKRLEIQTPSNFDFSLCILCFKIDEELKETFSFCI